MLPAKKRQSRSTEKPTEATAIQKTLDEIGIDIQFSSYMSPLTDEEASQLEANLITDGCRDPLVVWQGLLLDGHHRFEICTRLEIDFEVVEVELEDRAAALGWILENQAGRRNLTPDQISLLRGRIYNRAKQRQGDYQKPHNEVFEQGNTASRLAPQHGVSRATLERDGAFASAVEKLEDGAPTLLSEITIGKAPPRKTVIEAAKLLDHPDSEAIKARINAGESTINAEAARIKREQRAAERTQAILESSQAGNGPSTTQRYPVLLADPPWRYEHSRSKSREIENQYPTMELDAIRGLPVQELATDDAVLYLWATSPKLVEALSVMEAWGFEYKTSMVWVKPQIGMGYWARSQHELLLIGTRGSFSPPADADRPGSVIEAPRTRHSQKPDQLYEIIEKCFPTLPKIELFARSTREGWASWGHEAAS